MQMLVYQTGKYQQQTFAGLAEKSNNGFLYKCAGHGAITLGKGRGLPAGITQTGQDSSAKKCRNTRLYRIWNYII